MTDRSAPDSARPSAAPAPERGASMHRWRNEPGREGLGPRRRLGLFAALLLAVFGMGSAVGAAWPDSESDRPRESPSPETTVADHTDHSMSS